MAMLCCVTGRSGGHLIPCLTYAAALRADKPDLDLLFFSTTSPLDISLVRSYSFITYFIPLSLGNFPRKKISKYPYFIVQLLWVFLKSFFVLYKKRPERVISMGGYISIPVCLAARLLRIPVELFELNVIPGKANLFLAAYTHHINIVFPEAQRYFTRKKCAIVPYPLRFSAEHKLKREEAHRHLGLVSTKKTVLILGGSQGSQFLNKVFVQFVYSVPTVVAHCTILHQTGSGNIEEVQAAYKQAGISALVFEYRHDIHMLYSAADLVICRAGAGTLFEVLFFNKSAFVIPLQTATTNHQQDNARAIAAQYTQLITVFNQADLEKDSTVFYNKIVQVLNIN